MAVYVQISKNKSFLLKFLSFVRDLLNCFMLETKIVAPKPPASTMAFFQFFRPELGDKATKTQVEFKSLKIVRDRKV